MLTYELSIIGYEAEFIKIKYGGEPGAVSGGWGKFFFL
jgi:hypothetical protein